MAWNEIPRGPAAPPAAVVSATGAVRQAQAALTSIKNKLEAAKQRGAELETERGELAYAAHSGDRSARKRLTEINVELSQHQSETDSFGAALREAGERVVAAQAAAEREEQRAAAQQALELSRQMGEMAQLAGEAAVALVVRLKKFMTLADAAFKLGHGPSSGIQQANIRRALGNALSPLGIAERQPPSQRVELGALLQHYSATTARSANRVLGENTEEAA